MAMISRRKIISRSQSELDYSQGLYDVEEEVWFSSDKLFQDHITEILRKWDQIDDEIWGKIICMERNRRIAKAYSRVPVLTISGSEDGFDGYKIGLNGFDNPMRDALTKTVKSHIGRGVRVKMDDMGNVIIKRMSNCDVFIRGWDRESNSLSKDIIELSGELEFEKSVKLFDMKKFQAGIARELLSAYPDRRKLENQCICAIAFVKDAPELLDLCSWVMLINIVALDLLKSRFPTMLQHRQEQLLPDQPFGRHSSSQPKFVSIFDHSDQSSRGDGSHLQRSVSDEDPYSLPLPSLPHASRSSDQNNGSSSNNNNHLPLKSGKGKTSPARSSEPKPPELPPRDFAKIKKGKSKNLPQAIKSLVKSNNKSPGKQIMMEMTAEEKRRQEIEYEDPYYCGLQARVPNFAARTRKPGGGAPAAMVVSGAYGYSAGNETENGTMMREDERSSHHRTSHHQPSYQRSSSQHAPPAQLEIRKSQSSGYLNTLFNQSSGFFSKKLDPHNKRNSASFNSNPYSDSSLESDGYGISSGSGYDIYAPLSTPLYGRLRAQLHANGAHHQAANGSHNNNNNNKKSIGNNNVSSRTTNGNKGKNGLPGSGSGGGGSGDKNKTSSNNNNNSSNERVTGNNYRKSRTDLLAFERTERYASSWD